MMWFFRMNLFTYLLWIGVCDLTAQVTTSGLQNVARTEAPGTLLSSPLNNDSEAIGRTTSLNYLNG